MWRLLLPVVPAVMGVIAIRTRSVPAKVSVAVVNALILLFALPGVFGARLPALAVVAALAVSAVGDYFLATRPSTDVTGFVSGIGAFFLAHIGYLVFVLIEGRINLIALAILLAGYLPFYLFFLRQKLENPVLSIAVLAYLLVSCVVFAGAFGLSLPALSTWLFVAGIALLVISDTIIALVEFVGYKSISWLILPTYFLCHLSIVFSLLLWGIRG